MRARRWFLIFIAAMVSVQAAGLLPAPTASASKTPRELAARPSRDGVTVATGRGAEPDAERSGSSGSRSSGALRATPTAHRAYVAVATDTGAFEDPDGSVADEAEVRATVQSALTRWQQESNGAITSFTIADDKTFASATDCQNGSDLGDEAEKLYPGLDTGNASGNHLITIAGPDCAGGTGTEHSSITSGGRLNINWDPSKNLTSLLHELGHNLSLNHAHACYPAGPGCTVHEYGNDYAFMGTSIQHTPPFTPAALDSFERTRLGITDVGEIAPVTLPNGQRTTSSTYDLRARGTTTGLRGLRITDPTTGSVYSVDWRSGGGRDALAYYASSLVTYQTEDFNPGVTVEQIAPDGESATLQAYPKAKAGDGDLFGLTAGGSFTAGGVTLTVASTGDKNDPNATTRVVVTLTDPSVAPDTTIISGPADASTTTIGDVSFAFAGAPADATAGFDCRLDTAAWAACTSPRQLSALSDGAHTFAVRARDAAGHLDATPASRTFTVNTTLVPAAGAAGASGATGTFGAFGATGTTGAASPAQPGAGDRSALHAAKLVVVRAQVDRRTRRLNVLAPITALASGVLSARFRAAGRTTPFTAQIDSAHRRILVNQPLNATQARAGTGIVTLRYAGDADTQPQTVRLRAAARPARLTATRPTVANGRVHVMGTIDRRARGVVRLQLLYEPAGRLTRTVSLNAKVASGRFVLDAALPADVIAGILARQGALHSYVLFTGDQRAGLRGELLSYQVLGAPPT